MTATLALEIAFDGTTWEDVTSYLRAFSYNRGRTDTGEHPRTGMASCVFDNRVGTFDNDNASSPYYPNLRTGRPLRAIAYLPSDIPTSRVGRSALGASAMGASTVPVTIFAGRTEGGPQVDPTSDELSATWGAVDDLKRLNLDKSTTGFGTGSALTGTRIGQVLDGATPVWQPADRDLDPGVRTVLEWANTSDRLSCLFSTADYEGGIFFAARDGKAAFRDAAYAPATLVTFGNAAGYEPFLDPVTLEDDEDRIANYITVTAPGQSDVVKQDTESIADHGRIDLSLATQLSDAPDMDALAESMMGAHVEAIRRIRSLTFGEPTTNWWHTLPLDLGDRVIVRVGARYGGTVQQLSVIEGISFVDPPGPADFQVTYSLSAVPDVWTNNLLTANQSSIETSSAGWTAESGGTVARSTAAAYVGVASLDVAPTTKGTEALVATTPYTTAPVVVGSTYRAAGWVSSLDSPYPFYATIRISWRDSGGTELSVTSGSQRTIFAGGGWISLNPATGVAPASAAYAVVRVRIYEWISLGYPHLVDYVSLRLVI